MNFLNNIISVFTLVLILIISFSSCSTVDDIFGGDDDVEEFAVLPEKYSIQPYEASMLEISGAEITPGYYEGYIDDNIYVQLNVMDNKIYFFTPEISPGNYILSAYIDGYDLSVDIEIGSSVTNPNPEETINITKHDSQVSFDNSIQLDSLFLAAGFISYEDFEANKLNAQNRINQINELLSDLTEEEKVAYAKVYSANSDWITEFRELASSSFKSDACNSYLTSGINSNNLGHTHEANFHFINYKQCKIQNSSTYKLSVFIDKITTLMEQDQNGEKSTLGVDVDPATGLVAFLLGAVVLYTQWGVITAEMKKWQESVLSDDIFEDKSSSSFTNGQKKNFNQKVKFRAVDFSDSSDEGIIGSFVNMINKANDAIKRLLSVKPDIDINEFDLPSSNTSLDYNRNMRIDNISSNVSLKSSSIIDDNWVVIFETESGESQDFTFDLIYDDGFSQMITKPVTATLNVETELTVLEKLIEWGPYRTQNFQTETGMQYAVFEWNSPGSGCYCFQLSYYFLNGALEDSFPLCFTQYTDEYTYATNDDEPCPPDLNNPNDFEIFRIVSITQDSLIINDDGELWLCTPYVSK